MYSLEYVIETKTGKQLDSDKILSWINLSAERKSDMRTEVLQGIKDGTPLFLCGFCKQPVYLCGGKHTGETGKSFKEIYFKHYCHSPECKFYLRTKYSKNEIERMKFHGLKEGVLHNTIKNEIAQALVRDEYDVKIEGIVSVFTLYKDGIDSENYKRIWRRPDVQAKNKERQFVIEIQLATTFLSVILERMSFYKQSKHYVLWVLDYFNPEEEQKFTTMDILSLTNRNIFEFNDEMRQESKKQGRLVLRCHFEIPVLQEDSTFNYVWDSKIVYIEDLFFDDENYIAYFYNCWNKEKEILDEYSKKCTNIDVVEVFPYYEKQNYYEPHDNEEKFRMMLEELGTTLYYENKIFQDAFTSLYKKDFNSAIYYINKAQKNNLKLPQLDNVFLKLAIQVASEFVEYREVVNYLLCYKGFDYDIEKVFDNEIGKFKIAWDFGETINSLRSYLALFTQHGYSIPIFMIESCRNDLSELKNETINRTLSEDERNKIEKILLVTMWDKLQKKRLYKFLEMLENDKMLLFIIRLASYTFGKPLGCAHPNLAALSGTMKESHAPFAHLTVDMIKACKLDNDSKINRNFLSLQKIAQTNQDYSYDDLVYTLFKVFGR